MNNVFIWCTALVNFIIGVNIMYCFDHVEVGLWRVPILFIGLLTFNLLTSFGVSLTKSEKETA